MKDKCETTGCEFTAEFYDPMENKLCIDCILKTLTKVFIIGKIAKF